MAISSLAELYVVNSRRRKQSSLAVAPSLLILVLPHFHSSSFQQSQLPTPILTLVSQTTGPRSCSQLFVSPYLLCPTHLEVFIPSSHSFRHKIVVMQARSLPISGSDNPKKRVKELAGALQLLRPFSSANQSCRRTNSSQEPRPSSSTF